MTPLRGPADELLQIIALNEDVKPVEAEQRFGQLIKECPVAELRALDIQISVALGSFLKKRRRRLEELLVERLEPPAPPRPVLEQSAPSLVVGAVDPMSKAACLGSTTDPSSSVTPATLAAETSADAARAHRSADQSAPATVGRPHSAKRYRVGGSQLTYMDDKFSGALEKLSNFHIFQWGTFYREVLSSYFYDFLYYLRDTDKPAPLLRLVKAALSDHSKDIFKKGFEFYMARNASDPRGAITKSLAGLQRFLDLPLEFYSTRLGEAHHNHEAALLRQLCSAMAFGILNGYAATEFHRSGSQLLPESPQYWAYALPFLTHTDLGELVKALNVDDFVVGIQDSVVPLVDALDVFSDSDPELAPLPALSQYDSTLHRLDVSLEAPPGANSDRLYEIQCYIDVRYVHLDLIEKAAARAVSAVVAPLPSELRGRLASTDRFSDLVVHADGTAFSRRREVLAHIGHQNKPSSPDRPITFNWAVVFPLENQAKVRYKHVYRISVRRLMQSFEHRSGVRLWCSVRRSGKTTACASDLDSTAGDSALITQTCESTGLIVGGGDFYRHVRRALRSGEDLDDDFVNRTVAGCLPVAATGDARVVLILDEYETLFGHLQTAVDARKELRYTVVQPLLNQLVSFSHENLLIFMGQQPNAHFILMDQNQLSPVVQQDSFPLFTHDPASRSTGEFYELLGLALSGYIELDDDFVTRVYEETGGHPFLTVKLLISFMDWLIATKRPISCLAPVRPELFSEFTRSNLDSITILNNPNYDFFKGIASKHLSPLGRTSDPWLHSVYSALRAIVLCSPDSLSLSLDDYTAVLAPDCVGVSPYELLSTATRANFLILQDGMVSPRIPLLARIASAVTPI